MIVYDMEIDVALRRPPSPSNIRTTFLRLAVEEKATLTATDNEARLVAAWMGKRHGVMVTAVRITACEL